MPSSSLRKHSLARVAALAGIGLMGLGLAAQQARADDLSTSPYLFGDWSGSRTSLAEKGVKLDFGYTSELAHNVSGGTQHITRYTDQWNGGATFDLDKLLSWQGAKFYFMITDRNGRNLSADANLGTNQQVAEVYGRGQTWRLTNFYLEQNLLNDNLTLQIGRMGVGGDFAAFSCDFQNLTFCGSQPGNLVGSYWANWPVSQWAITAKLKTSAQTYLSVGAYQVNPNYVNDGYNVRKGLYPNFPDGTTGALIPIEFGYMPTVNGLPGSYKFGVWYNTSQTGDLVLDQNRAQRALTGDTALQRDGAYGGYINFSQQVTGTNGGDGVTVFLNATQADKFTSATDHQVSLGMEYKGIPGHPRDFIGAAVGATHNNGRNADYQREYNATHPGLATVVNDGYEYATEVFYSWSPVPSISVRPNLQYIMHPGGTSQNDNAFVVGLKTSIAF